eukprot:TRINITY_DN21708_c0_g1_i2.p1 TRINITY_DN21708_c0_g1~~TRINITY_DN21708_c0_g1_i2.p1  ORF type:complete len:110 (-),score=22.73 TRINITY_DN21708_c0_g1_i2:140-469(-)
MIRRPPRSTQGVSSAASDVYKRQPDIRLIKLDPSIDFLVLGSDGLFEAMHSREIVEEITLQLKKQNKSLLQIVTSLLPSLVAPKCSNTCLLYTSPSPRDLSTSRMPSSA